MNYRVRMTDEASGDLDRILGALAGHSAEAAARLARQFRHALDRLRTMPLSCGLAHESREFPEELRHLLFHTQRRRVYRALFVVRGDEVVILAVRAPGEKPVTPEELGT